MCFYNSQKNIFKSHQIKPEKKDLKILLLINVNATFEGLQEKKVSDWLKIWSRILLLFDLWEFENKSIMSLFWTVLILQPRPPDVGRRGSVKIMLIGGYVRQHHTALV